MPVAACGDCVHVTACPVTVRDVAFTGDGRHRSQLSPVTVRSGLVPGFTTWTPGVRDDFFAFTEAAGTKPDQTIVIVANDAFFGA